MKLTCNRKPKSERELPDMLHRLKKGSHLSEAMYRRLFLPDRATVWITEDPHKKNCHLEPIASFIGSLTYSLSKFLVVLLGPTTGKNGFTVRNSRELVQKQFLWKNDVLVSFSQVSPFTNLLTTLTVEVADAQHKKHYSLESRTTLTADDMFMLRFCLNQTRFAFSQELYHQTEFWPMGCSISAIGLAAFSCVLLQLLGFRESFYSVWVDDY